MSAAPAVQSDAPVPSLHGTRDDPLLVEADGVLVHAPAAATGFPHRLIVPLPRVAADWRIHRRFECPKGAVNPPFPLTLPVDSGVAGPAPRARCPVRSR